jgi:hypothetical protein
MSFKNTASLGLAGFLLSIIISIHESIYFVTYHVISAPSDPFSFLFGYTGLFFGVAILTALFINHYKTSFWKCIGFLFFFWFGFTVAFWSMPWVIANSGNYPNVFFSLPGILGSIIMLIGFNLIFKIRINEFIYISLISGLIGLFSASYFVPYPKEGIFFIFFSSPFTPLIVVWQTFISAALGLIVDQKENKTPIDPTSAKSFGII